MMHHSLIKKKKKRWQLGINCWGGKKKKNHQDIRTGNSSLFHLEPHHTTLSLIIFLLQHTYFLLVRVYKGTSRLQIIIRSIRITYEYSFMLLSFLSVYPSYIYIFPLHAFHPPCWFLLCLTVSPCHSSSLFFSTLLLHYIFYYSLLFLSLFLVFSLLQPFLYLILLSLSLFFISLAYFPFTFLSRALSLYISLSVYLCFCFFLFSFPSNAYSLPLSFTPVLPHSFFFFLYSLLPFHFFFFLSVNLAFLHKLFFFRLVLLRV